MCLDAKAGIRPGLSHMCQVRSTAVLATRENSIKLARQRNMPCEARELVGVVDVPGRVAAVVRLNVVLRPSNRQYTYV